MKKKTFRFFCGGEVVHTRKHLVDTFFWDTLHSCCLYLECNYASVRLCAYGFAYILVYVCAYVCAPVPVCAFCLVASITSPSALCIRASAIYICTSVQVNLFYEVIPVKWLKPSVLSPRPKVQFFLTFLFVWKLIFAINVDTFYQKQHHSHSWLYHFCHVHC